MISQQGLNWRKISTSPRNSQTLAPINRVVSVCLFCGYFVFEEKWDEQKKGLQKTCMEYLPTPVWEQNNPLEYFNRIEL